MQSCPPVALRGGWYTLPVRSLLLLLLVLVGWSSAAPLLGSRASFYSGQFCRAARCELLSRETVAAESLGLIVYTYRVRGGVATVTRNHAGAVSSAVLQPPTAPGAALFVRELVGGRVLTLAELRSCERRATSRGYSLTTGAGYLVECSRTDSGRPVLSVYRPHTGDGPPAP